VIDTRNDYEVAIGTFKRGPYSDPETKKPWRIPRLVEGGTKTGFTIRKCANVLHRRQSVAEKSTNS